MVESYNYLLNPYIGWYYGPGLVRLSDNVEHECTYYDTFNYVQNGDDKSEYGLQYLGIVLEEYHDRDISEKALTSLKNILNEVRRRKQTRDPHTQLIINFYYDNNENCKTSSSNKYFHVNVKRNRQNKTYKMKINGKEISTNECYKKVKPSEDSSCTIEKTENIEPKSIDQILRHV
ncbi:hypothetical protein PIROE2DRAFT_12638 [Piromyces sp. E2]|nr:hypothetical protein PIROE2DRAFT_12638 [Piromyces sp. E2]|eukprot:OUM61382.1 hypothetical protein PIROE2DRAFT_12638 [Piromyces sp. E2]